MTIDEMHENGVKELTEKYNKDLNDDEKRLVEEIASSPKKAEKRFNEVKDNLLSDLKTKIQESEGTDKEKVLITVENATEFTAGDIDKYLSGFGVLNPDLVICHLDPKASIEIELTINKGRGYIPSDENRRLNPSNNVNELAIDSIYTPIRNVKIAVENYRVSMKTDYEKLLLEITTDGSIHPKDALKDQLRHCRDRPW